MARALRGGRGLGFVSEPLRAKSNSATASFLGISPSVKGRETCSARRASNCLDWCYRGEAHRKPAPGAISLGLSSRILSLLRKTLGVDPVPCYIQLSLPRPQSTSIPHPRLPSLVPLTTTTGGYSPRPGPRATCQESRLPRRSNDLWKLVCDRLTAGGVARSLPHLFHTTPTTEPAVDPLFFWSPCSPGPVSGFATVCREATKKGKKLSFPCVLLTLPRSLGVEACGGTHTRTHPTRPLLPFVPTDSMRRKLKKLWCHPAAAASHRP